MKIYFYFLMEWAETFRALSDPQCGRLIKAMVEFERTGAAPSFEDDALLHFAWVTNIMPKMKTMQEHYRETVAKRSMAGKASATKRTSVNKCEQVLTSVNTREQNEQKPTVIDLDIDLDLDKKENSLKENDDVEFAEKRLSDDGLEIIKLYEERFGLVSTYKATQLDDLVKDFGKDAVAYAVRQANISSAPGIRYIRTTAMSFARRKEDGAGTNNNSSTVPNSVPKYGQGIVV